MSWSEIKTKIKSLDNRDLLAIIQDLYTMNTTNRRYLDSRFIPNNRTDIIEEIKVKLNKYTQKHKKQECRSLLNDYKRASNDFEGYIRLCLYHAECVVEYHDYFLEFNDNFLKTAITSFEQACKHFSKLNEVSKPTIYSEIKQLRDKSSTFQFWVHESFDYQFSTLKHQLNGNPDTSHTF